MSVPIDLPSWTVLIVEDDPLVQLGIEQALVDYPQIIVAATADDGYLAVESAVEHQPNLILMDIGLPGIDGIEATRQIKARLPDSKVVILTSHLARTEIFAAFASGADAYCVKGSEIETLLTAIATVHQGGLYLDPQIAGMVVREFKRIPPAQSESSILLSGRESDVLNLLVEGLTNTEIASRLYISPNTVKAHMRGLMNKLSASDRVQVAVKALRAGLI